jgi:HD-like signal output (HDOD) protein
MKEPAAPGDVLPGSCTQPVVATKRRILFVDDDEGVLDGLRAALRPQRRQWDIVFALGGPSGLDELSRSEFDVVVTDMRMPVIDGAELLRRVKEQQPRAVRIVLSGQTDHETAMKTVFTAHQFLAKPCEVTTLHSVVKRACDLHALLSADELRALAGDTAQLPAAPRTYLAMTEALTSPSCSIGDVARLVEREPALCAKVLQLVNSAFFGLPRSVSSVAQAAGFLGTLTLRNLALAMESLARNQAPGVGLSAQQHSEFQRNALLVGLLGRHWFAGDKQKAEEAFVAGMLRDMGCLLLVAQGRRSEAASSCHAALSGYLLGLWGIPHGVLEPVAYHERPEDLEHDTLEVVDIVQLADHIAAPLAPSPFGVPNGALDTDRLARLGVTPEQIADLRADATQLLVHTRKLLS